ncbi:MULTISPECIES: ABC transporter ATP-binding protein [unclassified Saccharopolyspora]|uniref:ATP-binding cassette domain-containing protein n=1 Tax=unclassified Saccharopolyspora TaxID=2646250 RepID=UPI001CD43265|nr:MULTISPECIES: ABC transporter ATP-binding protein [unclassified Saccharopolyspora]MCA1229388.1 ABC transporter ATP-binding protein/permease [Saccharopolyspora sp. 6M]MCA1283395.1 ABC transporter ATP-binding protein/permease [Saccharopolyspora sp. 7B]
MLIGEYRRALTGHRRGWAVLLACSALEAAPALLSGTFVRNAVDDGFAAGRFDVGAAWLLAFAAAAVVGAAGVRFVWRRIGAIVEPLRDVLVRRVVRDVLADTAPPRGGPDAAGVARITQHVEVVRDATAGLLVQARGLLVSVAAALAGVAALDPLLLWPVAPPVLLAVALFGCSLPALARRQRGLALADERTATRAGAVLTGLRDVAACGAQRQAIAAVRDAVDAQAAAAVRMSTAAALRTLIIGGGGLLPVLLVLAIAPWAVGSGRLTAGAVLGALVYVTGTVQPALHGLAATTGSVLLRLLVALNRLAEIGRAAPADRPRDVPAGPRVRARGLTHRWGEHAEPVLSELDLDLDPGEHLAVVGPSGIGKSTFAGLLTGTLAPTGGSVRVGGVVVTELDPAVRHRLIAFTPQEAYLFAGTVRENVALLAAGSTDAHLLAAAADVGAAELVARLGGLDGEVRHGGADLSAGQRQLLALARVHASAAPIVVLDEATSHLDGPAEARAERAFAARGGVLVVIAHRLGSARRANRVLLLDGTGAQLGTPAELPARSATYAELVRAWDDAPPGLSGR